MTCSQCGRRAKRNPCAHCAPHAPNGAYAHRANPPQPKAARAPRPAGFAGRRRARRFSSASTPLSGAPKPAQPIFAPRQTSRALKLAALVAIEQVFTAKLQEQGVTPEIRAGYETYKKLKALALGAVANAAMQNEADSALRMATVNLIKLAF